MINLPINCLKKFSD